MKIRARHFASQKRSFTCLVSLDVQDDKSVCAVGQILCGGEVINKRKYKWEVTLRPIRLSVILSGENN